MTDALERNLAATGGLRLEPNSDVEIMAALTTAQARIAELEAALRVYADDCDATPHAPCGYEGNLCCQTARRALEAKP